jgi:hypothetical protein
MENSKSISSNKESNLKVDWANVPTVSDLKKDYQDGTTDHSNQITKVKEWLDALNIEGSHAPTKKTGKSMVQPKLIRKQAEWRYASLVEPFLSTDDLFNVDPITYEDKTGAEQNQLVMNNQFNTKMNKVKFIGDYVRTAVNEGTVIVKTSWIFEEGEREVFEPVYEIKPDMSEETQKILGEMLAEFQKDGLAFEANYNEVWIQALEMTEQTQVPHAPIQTGIKKVTKRVTTKNHPWVEVRPYNMVLIDPTCKGDLTKANFIIDMFDTSLAELKKAGIYKNLDQIDIQSNSISLLDTQKVGSTNFNFSDNTRRKIRAYEYWGFWDIHDDGTLVPIVATYVGDVMIRLERNPYPDQKLPFTIVQYLPVTNSVYGEADASLLIDNQKILGAVTRGMVDIMARSANGQQGYAKGSLDFLNLKKFKDGEDYEFNPGTNPELMFYMHKFPEIPKSAEFMIQSQMAEAESITGIKSFSSGITGQSLGTTAIGVRSAMDATAKRDLDILRRLSKGIEDIGRKIISMNAVFLEPEEVIRITNEKFVSVRREDLEGNFDLRLTISTAEVDNQKAEELAFMLQTLGNSVDFGITKMILADIAKLRKMPTLAKRLEEYEPQPDPLAVQKAQLEIALLEAQVEESRAKAIHWASGAGLNEYKAQESAAKASKAQSDADMSNLNFVQEENGTNHARAIAQTRAQAEGNIQLEAVKAALNPKKEKESA